MFCRNCGKEIGDAKFCPHCGQISGIEAPVAKEEKFSDLLVILKKKIGKIGHERLIRIIACIATVINIIIRITENEIEVVRVALAYDDYYVISEDGKTKMLIVLGIHILAAVLLWYDGKKSSISVSKKTVIISLALLVIQIVAMLLRFPAPY